MKKKKLVGSAIVGNIVEYYDFGLYAVFVTTIGQLFFPESSDKIVQTLQAFSVFALGFMMRPLGGVFFGYIGDKFGRKTSLTISLLGMAFCTFCIGIIPTYHDIGITSTILLVLIRLFQGLCVGGQGAAVAIFVLEHTEGYRPGLIGSIVMASNMVGTLFATFIGIIIQHFCPDGSCWRAAFYLGGFLGLIGLWMRYSLTETPAFIKSKQNKTLVKNPLSKAIKSHWRSMLLVMLLGGSTSAVAYTIRGYMNAFFLEVMQYSQADALYFQSCALITMIATLPAFGILADRVGYRKFFYIVCYIIILVAVPIYSLMANYEHNLILTFLGVFLMGILSAAICAPSYPYAIKSFEVELRFSGVATSWNLGNALLGGTTPLISTYLTRELSSPIAPAFYLIAVAFALLFIKAFVAPKEHAKN
jgi:MHS family proline/betaine transporter-like MFS transporter